MKRHEWLPKPPSKRGGRPWKQFCPKGHDKAKGGINAGGMCLVCAEEQVRNHETESPRMDMTRIPFAPLEDRLKLGGVVLGHHCNAKSIRHWRKVGIPIHTADRLCVDYLAVHPFDVYGDVWYEAGEERTSA